MSTIEELEAQVAKLGREIRRLRGNPEASQRKAVEELTGPSSDSRSPGGEGAFSRALRQDATSDEGASHREIVSALRSNPELVINPTAEWAFRHNYPWIDYGKMTELINEATGRRK